MGRGSGRPTVRSKTYWDKDKGAADPFEIPKRVIVLEAFPKNTSGKVDKARLKKMWIEQEPQ